MAILFSKTPSHQYLRTTDTPCLQWGEADEAKVFTLSLWFKAANVTEDHTLLVLEHDTATNQRYTLSALGASTADLVSLKAQTGGTVNSASKGPFLANTWHHVLATVIYGTGSWVSLQVTLDNVPGIDKPDVDGPAANETFLQVSGHSTSFPAITGKIAEVAIYDVSLTGPPYGPDAVTQFAKGFRPPSVVPQHLIFYAPLDGRYQDLRGGHTLTPYNSPVNADDHPRMR